MHLRLLDSIKHKCFIPIPDTSYENLPYTDTILSKFGDKSILELKKESYSVWNFAGTDNYINLKQNLQFLKKNNKNQQLYHTTNHIKYTVNSFGYRTRQFDEIDWGNSIVIFGCSYVSGVGVDDNHTISSFLEEELNIPVINMGVGGSSNSFHLHNSTILSSFYPTPKAVIYVWSNMSRYFHYKLDGIEHMGNWSNKKKFKENIYDGINRNAISILNIQNLWKNKTIFLNCCWYLPDLKFYSSVIPDLDIFHLNYNTEINDYKYLARDMSHPGPLLHKKASNQLAKILKSCNL